MNKAVFFDRDGVLNDVCSKNKNLGPPKTLSDLIILNGVEDSVSKIKLAGFYTVVVTNQPDVSRGTISKKAVIEINNYISNLLKLDKVLTCFSDDDNEPRRKPNPGMLLEAQKDFNLDFSKCFLLGDRAKDIEAGNACNCTTILVNAMDGEREKCLPDFHVEDIVKAAEIILRGNKND
tara:strand:- start:380 stop:913 length:534 start_codon:yes stop_codon:yes gene_type:complete